MKGDSKKHETSFANHWRLLCPGLPSPVPEYRFAPPRRFRFDFAFPEQKVAVELHGGGAFGRHASVTGQASDFEKSNLAVLAGWRVLTFGVLALKDMVSVVETTRALLVKQ